jgi:hypothetical protein
MVHFETEKNIKKPLKMRKIAHFSGFLLMSGGEQGDRTPDLVIANHALSHLS